MLRPFPEEKCKGFRQYAPKLLHLVKATFPNTGQRQPYSLLFTKWLRLNDLFVLIYAFSHLNMCYKELWNRSLGRGLFLVYSGANSAWDPPDISWPTMANFLYQSRQSSSAQVRFCVSCGRQRILFPAGQCVVPDPQLDPQ